MLALPWGDRNGLVTVCGVHVPEGQVLPLIDKRLTPPPANLFAMGSPVSTGNKVGDASLTILASPFNLLKNVVWDGPKAMVGKVSGSDKIDTKEESVIDEEDKLTPALIKTFSSSIGVEDYFAMVPDAYRKMGKAPISTFIVPAYKRAYEHFLSKDKQETIMKSHPQTFEGRNEIVYKHVSIVLEIVIEYFFDQHFLQMLYDEESRFVPYVRAPGAPWTELRVACCVLSG